MVSLLLSEGADPDTADRDGNTPLMIAARAKLSRVAELLLQHSASVNERNDAGETALVIAERSGEEDLVRLLRARSKEQWSPVDDLLKACAGAGDVPALKRILEEAKPESRTKGGRTALMQSAAGGCIQCARLLIDKGADANAKDNHGETPLLELAKAPIYPNRPESSLSDVARILPIYGAEPRVKDNSGATALGTASLLGRYDLVRTLLDGKASVQEKDECCGGTPLHSAAVSGNVELVSLLLSKGAKVDSRSDHNVTPLMDACRNGKTGVAQLLLDKGADVNAASKKGWSPLMWAAEGGYIELVRLLLAKGADPRAKDGIGRTALSVAKNKGHSKVVTLLERAKK